MSRATKAPLLTLGLPLLALLAGAILGPQARAAETLNPVLKPGNELLLVIPEPKPTRHVVVIDPDGQLALSNYATIDVAGLKLDEARERARDALSKYIVRTAAITLVRTDDKHYVTIEGHVEKPGPARVEPTANIWQAIHAAGGPAEGADLTRVELVRGGQEEIVDIQAYLERTTKELPVLEPGDKVVVPKGVGPEGQSAGGTDLSRLSNKVFVFGAVRNPGLYYRAPGLTVLTAVGLAGGPNDNADLANVRLVTPDGTQGVNLDRQMAGEGKATPVPEEAGALVFVPRVREGEHQVMSEHVNVVGGVERPGRFTASGQVSLADALGLAGGPKDNGDLSDSYLLRVGAGYTFTTEYDLEDMLEEGGVAALVRMQAGDTLFVGQNAFEIWRSIVQFVNDIALISASIVILVSI